MKQFAPRELCEKLAEMGCLSDSLWIYDESGVLFHLLQSGRPTILNQVPAFEQNDFTGATEQARENARIAWGTEEVPYQMPEGFYIENFTDGEYGFDEAWKMHRILMTEATEPWWQYLERTMKR